MKKLKLNLDELKIESFETLPENSQQVGTVQGQDIPWTDPPICTTEEITCAATCPATCFGHNTCWVSCDFTSCCC